MTCACIMQHVLVFHTKKRQMYQALWAGISYEKRHMICEKRHNICAICNTHMYQTFWAGISYEKRHMICEKRHMTYEKRHMIYEKRHMIYEKRHMIYEKRYMIYEKRHMIYEKRHMIYEKRHMYQTLWAGISYVTCVLGQMHMTSFLPDEKRHVAYKTCVLHVWKNRRITYERDVLHLEK